MSVPEVYSFLRKSLGIIIKRLEETGVISIPSALDHVFIPEVTVDSTGKEIDVNGFVYKLKVPPTESSPVKFNIDRPVTSVEYSTVYPGMAKVIARLANKLYLQAPAGQTTKVNIEVLKL